MTDAPTDVPRFYGHKLMFDYFIPSRIWFLLMFLFGKSGGQYWYDNKYKGIVIFREKKP